MKFVRFNKIIKFSPKTYWKEIVAFLVILLAFVFFRSQRKELHAIIPQLHAADPGWILTGLVISCIYLLLQAAMYVKSFKAIGLKLNFKDSIELFLKRNFLSVFLPAGGISSLAFTTSQLRRKKINTTQIFQASIIYAYVGLLTVFIIGIPVITYTLWNNHNFGNSWLALITLGLMLGMAIIVVQSFRHKGSLYTFTKRKFPSIITRIDEMFSGEMNQNSIRETIIYSILIEFCGIAHALVAMYALHIPPSFETAIVGYTISVLLMIISPFLRGLGAVEFSMLFIFEAYGYSHVQGLGIVLLYRLFEFWLPLLFGFFAFIWRGRQLLARIAPAIAIFVLGLINIISVATPPLVERLRFVKLYLPIEAVHASKLMVLLLGIALIVTAAYLIKGMRAAWIAGLVFSALSFVGHIGKALDYEEAILSIAILLVLVFSSKQYRIRTNKKWLRAGAMTFIVALVSVCIFDFLSFYLIDKHHFGIDFTFRQSMYQTAKSFLLFSDESLKPLTIFGRDFLNIIHFLGFCSWLLLLYTLLKPRIISKDASNTETALKRAQYLLDEYGSSPLDYFKISPEKQIFFSGITDAFISYRVANNFAVVLDEPVCAQEDKEEVLEEFEEYCKKTGLKAVYYRVDENSIYYFESLKKQKMFIGQEAIMEIDSFKLEGKDKKSLRNGLNSLQKKGYAAELIRAPHEPAFLDELQEVSDEWLEKFDKKEAIFSQGMFNKDMLENHDIIVVKDELGRVQAFLNIIPDYTPDECTYDLIRRRLNAPSGCMDAMIVKFWEYAKEKKYKYLNLGLVPLTGDITPDNTAEQIMRFASQRVGKLKQYKSLRDFKEKYATLWANKYLIFGNDFDLLQLPLALNKVMKP